MPDQLVMHEPCAVHRLHETPQLTLMTAVAEVPSTAIDYVSTQLLPGAGLLVRLLVRELGGELSRTEVGLLNTLSDGPRRITEPAEFEGLAQPTMTQLVTLLQHRDAR